MGMDFKLLMNTVRCLFAVGLLFTGCPAVTGAEKPFEGDTLAAESTENSVVRIYSVNTIREQWRDPARGRALPVKIYLPAACEEPLPVILFSHGLGRSCEDYGYLGNAWASHGLLVIFVQHPGSDETVWRGTLQPKKHLKQAYNNADNLRQRPLDLLFALDRLTELQEQGAAWAQQADLSRVGAAGNDWGAEAALALAGEVLPDGTTAKDPRIQAVLALSPTVDPGSLPLEAVYDEIEVPCFYVAGTDDNGKIGQTKAAERRLPFDYSRGADQFLMTLYGADHMVYAGHIWGRREANRDAHYQGMIRESSLIFWEAYLKNDPSAKRRLTEGDLKSVLSRQARLETKSSQ
jgi:predicted dienelactone hydrolase